MGIDIYLRWDGITKDEQEAQYTGYSAQHGHVGYLREAYHGEPYATYVLFTENWDEQPKDGLVIPNSILQRRLVETMSAAMQREAKLYEKDVDIDHPVVKAFKDFVELHGKLEKEGKNPRILFSY